MVTGRRVVVRWKSRAGTAVVVLKRRGKRKRTTPKRSRWRRWKWMLIVLDSAAEGGYAAARDLAKTRPTADHRRRAEEGCCCARSTSVASWLRW